MIKRRGKTVDAKLELVVQRIIQEATDIRTFELVDPQGKELPRFTPGAHLDIFLPNGMVRQYSISTDAEDPYRYGVSVLRAATGRGGSMSMHDQVQEGDCVHTSMPRNHFPLSAEAKRHVLIAGGIGITPMLAMARRLVQTGAEFTLHYCARGAANAAFHSLLSDQPFSTHCRFHYDGGDPSKGLDVKTLLAEVEPDTHVYCCGPTGLVKAVGAASDHWPEGTVHFEFFAAPADVIEQPKDGFEVQIASTGAIHFVPATQSLLQVLQANGYEIDSSCEEGICGTCLVEVVDGVPDHRDMVLSTKEKQSNNVIVACCSRSMSKRLTLKL
jgi:vanillate O-demethylase ferredoxin subunit